MLVEKGLPYTTVVVNILSSEGVSPAFIQVSDAAANEQHGAVREFLRVRLCHSQHSTCVFWSGRVQLEHHDSEHSQELRIFATMGCDPLTQLGNLAQRPKRKLQVIISFISRCYLSRCHAHLVALGEAAACCPLSRIGCATDTNISDDTLHCEAEPKRCLLQDCTS